MLSLLSFALSLSNNNAMDFAGKRKILSFNFISFFLFFLTFFFTLILFFSLSFHFFSHFSFNLFTFLLFFFTSLSFFEGFGFGVQRLKDENHQMSIQADTECTNVQEYRYTEAVIDNFASLNNQKFWDGEGMFYSSLFLF